MRGECTWGEQFGYIYMCGKEIVKMLIMGDSVQTRRINKSEDQVYTAGSK